METVKTLLYWGALFVIGNIVLLLFGVIAPPILILIMLGATIITLAYIVVYVFEHTCKYLNPDSKDKILPKKLSPYADNDN